MEARGKAITAAGKNIENRAEGLKKGKEPETWQK